MSIKKFDEEELDWPAQIPNFWNKLQCWLKARRYHPTSVANPANALVAELEQSFVAKLRNLVVSLKREEPVIASD